MKDFEWGNMDKGTMFLDHKATLVPRNLRILFVQVAQQYISQGDTARAKELLVEALRVIPESVLPMDTYIRSYYVEMLNSCGETELSRELLHKSVTQISEEMAYYRILATQKNRKFKKIGKQKLEATTRDLQQNLNMAQRFQDSTAVQTLSNLQGGLR
jgi:predicted Zn-dependent protease